MDYVMIKMAVNGTVGTKNQISLDEIVRGFIRELGNN